MMTTKRFRGARWTDNEDAGDLRAQHEADASAAREEDRRGRVEAPRAPTPNKFPGVCVKCSARVEAGAGVLAGRGADGRYKVEHAGECPKVEAPAPRASVVEVPEGRYAVEVEGDPVKFYKVDRPTSGKWAGRVFVSVQASDEFYPVRGFAREPILAAIALDVRGAAVRYGRELGVCSCCGRTLTDEASRAAGIGPICAAKHGW